MALEMKRSSENTFHNFSGNIGEAIVTALKAEGEPLVVETEQVKNGRLQIVHMNFILSYTEAQFVRFAIHHAALHAASGHDHRITVGIMVAAQYFALGRASLAEGRAAKLTAENDQRLIEQ